MERSEEVEEGRIAVAGVPLKLVFNGPWSHSGSRGTDTGSGGRQHLICEFSAHDGGVSGKLDFFAESVPLIGNLVRYTFGEQVREEWFRGLMIALKQAKDSAPKIIVFGKELSAVIHYESEYLNLEEEDDEPDLR